jgi:YVTN family beta-propeller protein
VHAFFGGSLGERRRTARLLEFRILGPLEVVAQGRALALGGAKQRALLAVLLLHRREVISTDRLIDELWGARPPATALKTVQVYVSHLRKALGVELLLTRGGGYVLAAEPEQVDLDRFEELAAEGRRALEAGEHRRASKALREALALWRGPPLADFAYETFAGTEIRRLEEARLAVLGERIEADLALGDHARLVGELEALCKDHPLQEQFQRQLMLALYRSGRQADALDRYRQTRQAMIEELGLEPGRELQELERGILERDPALDAPGRAERLAARARVGRGGVLIAGGGFALLAAAVAAAAISSGGGSGIAVSSNSVAVINPGTDQLTADVPVGVQPADISAGGGAVWVANSADASVSRIDGRTHQVTATIAPGGAVDGMAAGEGAVWTSDVQRGTLSRIDPAVRRVDRRLKVGRGQIPAAAGPVAIGAGSVWVGNGRGAVSRISARTGRIEASIAVGNDPSAIAVGAGGVWVADDHDNTVTRIDPATNAVVATIPVGPGPRGIAAGAGGVWVAEPYGDAVARIDPKTNSVTDTIQVGIAPTGVAAGADSVWVANSGSGSVIRVDPTTRRVGATIDVGGAPQSLVVSNGSVWASVQGPAPAASSPGAGSADTARVYMEPALFGVAHPGSTDPALALPSPTVYATCGLLLNYPDQPFPAGARLRPEIAEAMPTVSNGGRTYTYRVRDGFRFSPPGDTPVTAQAFRAAIERSLNPRMNSPALSLMQDVVGFHAYEAGHANHLAGVVVKGNRLSVTLRAPSPTLPARLASSYFCAIPPGTPIDRAGINSIPSAGPYYIASPGSSSGLVLKHSPGYAGDRPGHFDEIDLLPPVAQQQAIAQVESGRADALNLVPGEPGTAKVEAAYGPQGSDTSGPPRFLSAPTLGLHYLVLNTRRPLFSDAQLRRAASYAVDRRALAHQPVTRVSGHPTDQYIPPGMLDFEDAHLYPLGGPDLARARRLATGHGGRAVMYTCNTAACGHNAAVVRADLKPIGIAVRIRQFSTDALYRKLIASTHPGASQRWDIADTGWFADYGDPYTMINVLFAGRGVAAGHFNLGGFDDPPFERRMRHVAALTGPGRYRAYARLDAALAKRGAPAIAYANETKNYFFSARVSCQVVQPLYGLDLAALCARP